MDRGAWAGYSPGGHKESDLTERLSIACTFHFSQFLDSQFHVVVRTQSGSAPGWGITAQGDTGRQTGPCIWGKGAACPAEAGRGGQCLLPG